MLFAYSGFQCPAVKRHQIRLKLAVDLKNRSTRSVAIRCCVKILTITPSCTVKCYPTPETGARTSSMRFGYGPELPCSLRRPADQVLHPV